MTGWLFLWNWKCKWQETDWMAICVNHKEDLDYVCVWLEQSPRESLVSQACMSYLNAQGTVKKLNLWLYHIHIVHKLIEPDKTKCLQYCKRFQAFVEENGMNLLGRIFFRDEAWSHLDRYVNCQSSRIWSSKNRYLFYKVTLTSWKAWSMVHCVSLACSGTHFLCGNSWL
jgi:hypothetical protein